MIQIHSPKKQPPKKNRLCAFVSRAQGLGFVLYLSFGSLPHCLRKSRVGLREGCWECWVEHGQLTQEHNWQNVNETECLFRVCDAQGFWRLAYCIMFPRHTLKIEELVMIHPNVNLSSDIISDSAMLWETAVCFLHIQEMGTNVCDADTNNKPPGVDFESRKSPANNTPWIRLFVTFWKLLSFWLECTLRLRHLFLQSYQESLRESPRNSPLPPETPKHPCSVNAALYSSSSLALSSRSTSRPLYFWTCFANSAFFKWQMSNTLAN